MGLVSINDGPDGQTATASPSCGTSVHKCLDGLMDRYQLCPLSYGTSVHKCTDGPDGLIAAVSPWLRSTSVSLGKVFLLVS